MMKILAIFALFVTLFVSVPVARATPTNYYVSRNGNNSTGLSWTNAWNELDQISWTTLNPGDVVNIDGGSTQCTSPFQPSTTSPYNFPTKPGQTGSGCGMLYNTKMTVGKSGNSTSPIIVRLSSESGRNGTAAFYGGRLTDLPSCEVATYSPTFTGNHLSEAIYIGSFQYIYINGTHRAGIMIYGADVGVTIHDMAASNINLLNMEIFDNGVYSATAPGSTYQSDNPGIYMSGTYLTFNKLLIHDNGQDGIQDRTIATGSHQSNVVVNNSWIYNSRENPSDSGWGFNTGSNQPCTHPDALQTWNGGAQNYLTVANSLIGPYLGQGLYPADSSTGASWSHVVIANDTFFNVWYDSINADTNTTDDWNISNVTSYKYGAAPDGVNGAHLDGIRGTNNVLTNSLFVGASSDTHMTGFSSTSTGNYYYNTDPVPGGTNVNPAFATTLSTGTPHWTDLTSINLNPLCSSCTGKGSTIHNVLNILSRIDSLN